MCPTFEEEELEFSLSSDVLGSVTRAFNVTTNIERPEEVTPFEFNYNWK